MKITVIGAGYVGLVTAACLADMGNSVTGVDVSLERIALLHAGKMPIHEPGLDVLVRRNLEAGRLRLTSSHAEGLAGPDIVFIAVGTPPREDGSADLQHVLEVARTIGDHLLGYAVIVDKSTVPVGTADKVREKISAAMALRNVQVPFDVVSIDPAL